MQPAIPSQLYSAYKAKIKRLILDDTSLIQLVLKKQEVSLPKLARGNLTLFGG